MVCLLRKFSQAELKEIAEKNGIRILSDEVYRQVILVYFENSPPGARFCTLKQTSGWLQLGFCSMHALSCKVARSNTHLCQRQMKGGVYLGFAASTKRAPYEGM
jgi:hypothetical protein